MSKPTRNGVYWDLKASPYTATVESHDYTVKLFFSSELHRDAFIARYHDYKTQHIETLEKRQTVRHSTLTPVPALMLYKKIETRGCYIELVSGSSMQAVCDIAQIWVNTDIAFAEASDE